MAYTLLILEFYKGDGVKVPNARLAQDLFRFNLVSLVVSLGFVRPGFAGDAFRLRLVQL